MILIQCVDLVTVSVMKENSGRRICTWPKYLSTQKNFFHLALKKSQVDHPFTGNIYHLRGKIRLEGELSIYFSLSFLSHEK